MFDMVQNTPLTKNTGTNSQTSTEKIYHLESGRIVTFAGGFWSVKSL